MINGGGPDFEDDADLDYRDVPPGPERQAAKAETFRLMYSAAGQHELADEPFVVRLIEPETWWVPPHIEWKGTITGRLQTRHPRSQ